MAVATVAEISKTDVVAEIFKVAAEIFKAVAAVIKRKVQVDEYIFIKNNCL